MKIRLLIVATLCSTVFLFCSKKESASDIAVIVNGQEISNEELEVATEMLKQDMAKFFPTSLFDELGEMRKNAAQQLIANILMVEDAEKNNISVDSAMVEKIMDQMATQFSSQQEFQQELAKMGETKESLYSQIETSLIVEENMENVIDKAPTVSEEEMKEFFENNKDKYREKPSFRLSQIVLDGYKENDTAAQKEILLKAESILGKIQEGENFDALAQKFSSMPSNMDMGFFGEGELRKDLEDKVLHLKVGEVSDIITAKESVFLFKKTEEKPGRELPYEEVRENLQKNLELKKQSEHFNDYITELMDAAEIVYVDSTLIVSDTE